MRFRLASPGSEASEGGKSYTARRLQRPRGRGAAAPRPAMAAVLATAAQAGLSSVGSTGQEASSSTGQPGATSSTGQPGAKVILTPRRGSAALTGDEPRIEGNSLASRQYRKRLCDECNILSDQKIHDLNTRARKGAKFTSHTDRYHNDSTYRGQMLAQRIPEWLVWKSNGTTSRVDGQLGDQWSVD